jgi:type IV secretory pathway TrbD component
MNEIRASVIALDKPTTRMDFIMHKLLTSLGPKTVKEALVKYGSLGGVFEAIGNQATKSGINVMKAFGKVNAITAYSLLTGISKGDYFNNLAGTKGSDADFAAAYALKLLTLKSQSELLQNELQYFAIKAGTILIPILVSLAKFIKPVIEWFAEWGKSHKSLTKAIIISTGAIGSLLLVIAPIALIISGIADAVKLYAGAQLLFTSSTATAAAAVATQTVAVATSGTQLSLFATGAATAQTAAAGLFATLSEFVLPAALVALSGLAIWKMMKEDGKMQDYGNSLIKGTKMTYNTKNPIGLISPFSNPAEESAYQKYYLQQRGKGVSDSLLDRSHFDALHGKEYPTLINSSDLFKPTPQTHHLEITLKHPDGTVDTVKHTVGASGSPTIPHAVKQTSTIGNK